MLLARIKGCIIKSKLHIASGGAQGLNTSLYNFNYLKVSFPFELVGSRLNRNETFGDRQTDGVGHYQLQKNGVKISACPEQSITTPYLSSKALPLIGSS